MIWEEFENVDQFRPENMEQRNQSRSSIRRRKVATTTYEASTSTVRPRENPPPASAAIAIDSSEWKEEGTPYSSHDGDSLRQTPRRTKVATRKEEEQ